MPLNPEKKSKSEQAHGPKVILVGKAKNEGPYLLEWIAYHYALGIDHILLVTNDLDDGSELLLQKLHDHGVVTFKDVTDLPVGDSIGRRAHKAAFNEKTLHDHDWVLVLDIDEFLVLKNHNNIKDFISGFEHCDAVVLYWRLFGSSGKVEAEPDKLVIETFTGALSIERTPTDNIKAISKVKSLKGLGAHICTYNHDEVTISNANGELLLNKVPCNEVRKNVYHNPLAVEPNFENAQVNHYAIKSVEDYLSKQVRGVALTRVSGSNPKNNFKRFYNNNFNDVTDICAFSMIEKTKDTITEITSKCNLEDINKTIKERFLSKIEQLKKNNNQYNILKELCLNNNFITMSYDDIFKEINKDPEDVFYWEILYKRLQIDDNGKNKYKVLKKAISLNPIDPRIILKISSEFYRNGYLKEAKKFLKSFDFEDTSIFDPESISGKRIKVATKRKKKLIGRINRQSNKSEDTEKKLYAKTG